MYEFRHQFMTPDEVIKRLNFVESPDYESTPDSDLQRLMVNCWLQERTGEMLTKLYLQAYNTYSPPRWRESEIKSMPLTLGSYAILACQMDALVDGINHNGVPEPAIVIDKATDTVEQIVGLDVWGAGRRQKVLFNRGEVPSVFKAPPIPYGYWLLKSHSMS